MLYDLNWLATGKQFPPEGELERLQRYDQNRQIFENKHGEIYGEQWKRIEKVVGNTADIISYPIVLNYQKKVSIKTADFLFVERPIFTSDNPAVDEIVTASDLYEIGYEGVIDCSRFGAGVYKIDVENNKGKISISSPSYTFAIVDKEDRKKIKQYVLAWVNEWKESGVTKGRLYVKVHDKGKYSSYTYDMSGTSIGKLIESKENIPTGLDDFAIVPIHNLLTSDSVWGIDDYADIDSIISELEIRTAQISKILDVHASPTVSGSQTALTEGKDGKYTFKAGNYYSRMSQEEPPLEYVTWDANLDSNFKQIDKLLNHLASISEMGVAIFNSDIKLGQVPSGTALRMLYINVLAKVTRVRNSFDKGFKKAIALASQIGYTRVEPEDITITWQDGLPDDPKETAEIISVRTGGKATMSQRRALKQYDGMTEDAVEEELAFIAEEDMAMNGTLTLVDDNEDDTDEVIE